MDIQKFQQKLTEVCELGEKNGKVLKPEQIKECFGELDLDKSQLIKILQYLKLKGISIEGAEVIAATPQEETEDTFVPDLLQNFSDKETAFQVHKVLHKLPEPYKEVFSLRVFGELSFATISSLFGKSESWARVTYHRACKKIREELNHEDHL